MLTTALLSVALLAQIPADCLRPYEELQRELYRPQREQIEKLRKERDQLQESVNAVGKKATSAEKREATKTKKRIAELDAEIAKIKTSGTIPKLTIDKMKDGDVAYVVDASGKAATAIAEDAFGDPEQVAKLSGQIIGLMIGERLRSGEKITLNKPALRQQTYLWFFDDKSQDQRKAELDQVEKDLNTVR